MLLSTLGSDSCAATPSIESNAAPTTSKVRTALDLVFPNRFGQVRTHTTVLKRHFKPLCARLGIEMRWHDLRHFAVSLWIEQGFSIKEVMTFAGHRSIQMTMERYGHLFPSPDHQRGMAEIEARLLG